MLAVGMYLRTLREGQHLSRAAIATLVGTHESQIVRIEAGDQDTRGSQLMKIVAAVKGSLDHVMQLMLDDQADEHAGRDLAERVLSQGEVSTIWAAANTDPKRAALVRRIIRLTDDPAIVSRLQGYLDALESEGRS